MSKPLVKFPDSFVRIPRERLADTLRKCCARLTQCSVKDLHPHSIFSGKLSRLASFSVHRLWVVGSFARGAATCGDLDLVMEVTGNGGMPPTSTLKSEFFGRVRDVQLFTGKPEDNSSGAVFPDAVLVWEAGLDSDKAIGGIAADSTAARFVRPYDVIPVRPEQHGMTYEQADALLEGLANRTLQWTFVPLSQVTPRSVPRDDSEALFFRKFSAASQARAKALPYLVGFLDQLRADRPLLPAPEWDWMRRSAKVGGLQVHFDHLGWFDPARLDDLDCPGVVYMPPLNAKGPNGFWLIEKGPEHSHVQEFQEISRWVLTRPTGDAMVSSHSNHSDPEPQQTVMALTLMESQAQAEAEVEGWRDPEFPDFVPRQVSGRDLLDCVALADVLWLDSEEMLPVTRDGVRFVRSQGEPVVQDIAEHLRNMAVAA